jgi:L-cysteine/cystine lyase
MSAERWAWWREQTPALKNLAYVNTGFTGLLSNDVAEAMHRRIEFELAEGWTTQAVMDDGRQTRERLTELFAQVFGADAHEVALTTSTSLGVSSVIAAFELSDGDRLLTSSVEHGAGAIPLYHSRLVDNTEVEFIPVSATDSHGEIAERFISAINERTKVVGLSEISFSTGQRLPIKPIVEAAHGVGAIVVIDGAQTGGHIPIDVRESGVDAYAIPAQKWLCGPRGVGALYVSPEALPRLQPVLVDMSYADEWDLEGTFFPKQDVAGKFQFAAVPPILAAGTVPAIEQYFESGPQAIWDQVRALTELAEHRFEQIDGVTIHSPRTAASRTGLFCFRAEGIVSTDLPAYLQSEHGVVCRAVRQEDVVRLSLHTFNNEDDIERVARGVEQALRDGVPSVDH